MHSVNSPTSRCSVIMVLGEGGVGKTSIAAAIGLATAQKQHKVLVLTVDPSNRLRTALGLRANPGTEEPVFLDNGTSLHAMVLDTQWELQRLLERLIPSESRRKHISQSVFFQEAAGMLAGTHEILGLLRLQECVASGRYDVVVLDTPPYANALDFLDAPNKLQTLLDNEAFKMFLRLSQGASRLNLKSLRLSRLVLRGISRFSGEETFLALLDFILALSPYFSSIMKHITDIRSQLSASKVLLVCRPDDIRQDHLLQIQQDLQGRHIPLSGVILNRQITWPPPPNDPLDGFCSCRIPDIPKIRDQIIKNPTLGLLDKQAAKKRADEVLMLAAQYYTLAKRHKTSRQLLQQWVHPILVTSLPRQPYSIQDIAGLMTLARLLDTRMRL